MMRFVQRNLLDAKVEALAIAVNTVGVMGKGIALMFKEAFPANFRAYEDACKNKQVRIGRMFVTERQAAPAWRQPQYPGGSVPPNRERGQRQSRDDDRVFDGRKGIRVAPGDPCEFSAIGIVRPQIADHRER
jgi:hypothetical protein